MDRLAIIDGDPIVYSVAYALQQYALSDLTCNGHIVEMFDKQKEAKLHAFDIGLEEDEYEILPYSDASDDTIAEYITYAIADIMDCTEASEATIWLSSPTNFRKEVDPDYKAHRGEKPILHKRVRHVMLEQFGAVVAEEDFEADDEIAQQAIDMIRKGQGEDYIICSIDKDLDTIPGWHYNWPIFNREGRIYHVDVAQAMHTFWISVLTGDAADNIPGLDKVGPKRAEKYLVGCRTSEEYSDAALTAYFDKMGPELSNEEIEERFMTNITLLSLGKEPTYG